jgi:hypothetical protein
LQPAIAELIRHIKETGKVPSQDNALQIGYHGIKKHNEQYDKFGDEMHRCFAAFDSDGHFKCPSPKHEAYMEGFLYFRRQHDIVPLLIEQLLTCPHCGITTQVDLFAKVDDLYTVIDYKTGHTTGANTPFQLAVVKHVLEHLGHKVDRTWAVHIQEYFGYPVEICAPWEDVELRFKNAELKYRTLRPNIYIRERSGQKKEAQSSEELKTSQEQESAHETNFQGHLLEWEALGLSPTWLCSAHQRPDLSCRICRGREDISLPEITAGLSQPAVPIQKRRSKKPRKDQAASTSLHTGDFQQQIPNEEVELDPKHLHPERLKRDLIDRISA